MSRSSKLFLAAAIVAAGYGLASLFGPPTGRRGESALPPRDRATLRDDRVAGSGERGHEAGPAVADAVRLLPEAKVVSRPVRIEAGAANALDDSPSGEAKSVARGWTSQKPTQPQADANNSKGAAEPRHAAPRAMLLDSTPRPIWTEEPATFVTTAPLPHSQKPPAVSQDSARPAVVAPPAVTHQDRERSLDWSLPREVLSVAAPAIEETTSPSSSYQNPPRQESWRTHIVVDGDSLQKLAGRYLDDPRRAQEIYALNRHLLATPELLPIGLELNIPAR